MATHSITLSPFPGTRSCTACLLEPLLTDRRPAADDANAVGTRLNYSAVLDPCGGGPLTEDRGCVNIVTVAITVTASVPYPASWRGEKAAQESWPVWVHHHYRKKTSGGGIFLKSIPEFRSVPSQIWLATLFLSAFCSTCYSSYFACLCMYNCDRWQEFPPSNKFPPGTIALVRVPLQDMVEGEAMNTYTRPVMNALKSIAVSAQGLASRQ